MRYRPTEPDEATSIVVIDSLTLFVLEERMVGPNLGGQQRRTVSRWLALRPCE